MTFSAEKPTRTQTTPSTTNPPKTKLAQHPKRKPRAKTKAPTTRTKVRVPRGPMPVSPRPGSKTAKVLALLKRPQGAGLKELLRATGWQPHSVRGFLSGIVARKMGLKVNSSKTESGERRYAVKA